MQLIVTAINLIEKLVLVKIEMPLQKTIFPHYKRVKWRVVSFFYGEMPLLPSTVLMPTVQGPKLRMHECQISR